MASKFASKQFWVDTFDRVVASTAQGVIGAAALDTTGLLEVDWEQTLSVGGAMGLLSLLTAIAFRGNGGTNRPAPGPGVDGGRIA